SLPVTSRHDRRIPGRPRNGQTPGPRYRSGKTIRRNHAAQRQVLRHRFRRKGRDAPDRRGVQVVLVTYANETHSSIPLDAMLSLLTVNCRRTTILMINEERRASLVDII